MCNPLAQLEGTLGKCRRAGDQELILLQMKEMELQSALIFGPNETADSGSGETPADCYAHRLVQYIAMSRHTGYDILYQVIILSYQFNTVYRMSRISELSSMNFI